MEKLASILKGGLQLFLCSVIAVDLIYLQLVSNSKMNSLCFLPEVPFGIVKFHGRTRLRQFFVFVYRSY